MKLSTFATTLASALLAAAIATPTVAQDANAAALKARQGQMRIIALNLGVLGGMAQGKMEYNAEAAQNAADSLVAVSGIHQATLFPEGSGDVEGTKALPAVWSDWDGYASKWDAFGTAAEAMQQVASNGQDALGSAMGGLGGSCKGCHETYRASNN